MSVHFRVTFLTPFVTTVVFFTVTLTWTVPQRSASAAEPRTFLVTTVFFVTVVGSAVLHRRDGVSRGQGDGGRPQYRCQCSLHGLLLFRSEREALRVDVAGRNVRLTDALAGRICHRRWPADVHLALGDIGDELL